MAIFGRKDRDAPPPEAIFPPAPLERSKAEAKNDAVQAPRREVAASTTVGPTIRVTGEVSGDEDVLVEGRIEGMLNLTRALVVGKTGVVEADVRALSVVVQGRIVGNVIAEQRVEIHPTGRLEGNIKSPKISIHEGAHFKGNVDMSGGGGGIAAVPAAAPVVEPAATSPGPSPTRRA